MSSPDDAIQSKLVLPPALVEAAQEDPEVVVKLARAQLVTVQHRMVNKLLTNPDASIAAYAQVHERLTKTAELAPKTGTGGPNSGPMITINFVRAPGKDVITIEGSAQALAEPEGQGA